MQSSDTITNVVHIKRQSSDPQYKPFLKIMSFFYFQLRPGSEFTSTKTKVSFTGFYLRMNSQKIIEKVIEKGSESGRYHELSKKDKSLIRNKIKSLN